VVDSETGRTFATAGSWWLRGEKSLTLPWLIEAAAQAAARLLAPHEASSQLALAAIEQASLARPIAAGECMDLRVRVVGHWHRWTRVECEMSSGGEELGRLSLTLASNPGAATERATDQG